ncbi:MAG: Glutaredoxin-3 [Alphaproteobacteria bacterium MarineAlpha8_Bin1]|nr:MAG: Glutaredoxin-3 [Alphaproteobacteria bacterium MarineAlpha8_Bin1]|tara:strand:- start:740 stop:1000 length:261 start_codon:yes stop_codon:yes gene_type:complete
MKKILIYSSKICPYCIAAKRLFKQYNLKFEEKNIDNNLDLKNEMMELASGRKTVPQIFFDDLHIGGYDDLYKLSQDVNLKDFIYEK